MNAAGIISVTIGGLIAVYFVATVVRAFVDEYRDEQRYHLRRRRQELDFFCDQEGLQRYQWGPLDAKWNNR